MIMVKSSRQKKSGLPGFTQMTCCTFKPSFLIICAAGRKILPANTGYEHKTGQYRWMLARGVAVWDPSGFASRIAGSQTDINERKNLEEQLRYDALHDFLTGLGNRTLLIDRLVPC